MGDRFHFLLEEISRMSKREIIEVPSEVWSFLTYGLTPEQVQRIMILKNIKIFGSLNAYVHNIFETRTVERILAMPMGEKRKASQTGLEMLFNTLETYSELTEDNRTKIQEARSRFGATPAAAGGSRKSRKNRKTVKQRRLFCRKSLK